MVTFNNNVSINFVVNQRKLLLTAALGSLMNMSIEEINFIMSLLGNLGIGALVGGGVVFLLIKSFIPSYLSEKGKNLATKEDIATITDKVESVKTDYAKVLEEIRNNNQLKLAEIEREKNIKKEVFLGAVEALTKTQITIVNLSNIEIPEQQISVDIVNNSGAIAKIDIVGSESTVKAVTTIMAAIGTAILELMLERNSLVIRKNKITLLETYQQKETSEINRYISIMTNINLEGIKDERLWAKVNDNIEFHTQQRDKYSKEIDELWIIQNTEHFEFTKKCMDRHFEISALLPDAVLSIREELNLEISDEAYLDIFNNNIEVGKQVFSNFIDKLSKKIA